MIFFPYQKKAAVKVTSVVCQYQTVSRPHGMIVFDYRQNICPFLPFPPENVFFPDIGDKVGEAAFSTAMALFFAGRIIQVHVALC
jgi:hypothetical protein